MGRAARERHPPTMTEGRADAGGHWPLSGRADVATGAGGNAFEITVARLAQAIKLGSGAATASDCRPERELAERLQVSRVTLREAIAALREAGYLESRRGRARAARFVVRSSGPDVARRIAARAATAARALAREMGDTLHDALDFRRVLEPGAAALAADPRPVRGGPAAPGRLPGARRATADPQTAGGPTPGSTWRSPR